MTPGEVIEYARQQRNAVSDGFYTDSEMYRLLWAAQMELAREAYVIERTYTTSSVVGQREYSYPSQTLAIKRITFDGVKLAPITFREDDWLTNGNESTTATGTPQFYATFYETIYLRPVPATVGTIKIWSYSEPQEVSSTSTLEVPSRYHLDLADYLLWRMATKDQDQDAAALFKQIWDGRVAKARSDRRREQRGDSFAAVLDTDVLNATIVGAV